MLNLKSKIRVRRRRDGGSVLITTALCVVGLIGALGMVVDLGRAFITKGEMQVYTDSAALAATMELDGTTAGLQRARDQLAANTNKWNLATSAVSGSQIQFSQSPTGPWDPTPLTANRYLYARVTAQAPLTLFFMPAVTASQPALPPPSAFIILSNPSLNVSGDSAAGQQAITVFHDGLLPFSPLAHNATGPHFGLVPGQLYTLRWASNPQVDKNVCPGDNSQAMIDLSSAGGGSERGYIEDTSASVIRTAIESGYQTYTVEVGGTVNMTGGAKQTELDALINRVGQDTDPYSATYADYVDGGHGNGRRLVPVPINSGYPNYTVLQISAFLLEPASTYDKGGNSAWCAEYVGAWVKGAANKGASDSGAFVPRLVK